MSRSKYARKAQRFEVRDPEADASEAQVKSCNWLLRTRSHSVEFGNTAINTLMDNPTRGECDVMIKHLAKCPTMKRAEVKREVEKAQDKAESMTTPVENLDEYWKLADIGRMVCDGKLGKVAQRKVAAI